VEEEVEGLGSERRGLNKKGRRSEQPVEGQLFRLLLPFEMSRSTEEEPSTYLLEG